MGILVSVQVELSVRVEKCVQNRFKNSEKSERKIIKGKNDCA